MTRADERGGRTQTAGVDPGSIRRWFCNDLSCGGGLGRLDESSRHVWDCLNQRRSARPIIGTYGSDRAVVRFRGKFPKRPFARFGLSMTKGRPLGGDSERSSQFGIAKMIRKYYPSADGKMRPERGIWITVASATTIGTRHGDYRVVDRNSCPDGARNAANCQAISIDDESQTSKSAKPFGEADAWLRKEIRQGRESGWG